MRIVAIVFGTFGSIALFIAALVVLLGAGISSAIGEDELGTQLALMGLFGLIASVVGLIGACLSIAKPRFASITMLVALIVGAIATGGFGIPGIILLAIAVLFAFFGRNKGRSREAA